MRTEFTRYVALLLPAFFAGNAFGANYMIPGPGPKVPPEWKVTSTGKPWYDKIWTGRTVRCPLSSKAECTVDSQTSDSITYTYGSNWNFGGGLPGFPSVGGVGNFSKSFMTGHMQSLKTTVKPGYDIYPYIFVTRVKECGYNIKGYVTKNYNPMTFTYLYYEDDTVKWGAGCFDKMTKEAILTFSIKWYSQ